MQQRDADQPAFGIEADVVAFGGAVEVDRCARVSYVQLEHVDVAVIDDVVEGDASDSNRHGSGGKERRG